MNGMTVPRVEASTYAMSAPNSDSCTSIDEFRNKVYSTVYSMVIVFGLVGNVFAIYVLIKTYNQKMPFHIYILNLAVSDIFWLLTLPFRIIYYVRHGDWPFGSFLCRISSYALYVNLYCSIFFMTAMSFTRFIAIVFPVKHLNLVNAKKAKITCACIWGFVILTSSPFLMSGSFHDAKSNKTKCFEPPSQNGTETVRKIIILNYISLIVGFIIPFSTILVCYTMIIKTLLKSSVNKRKSSHVKAIRMIIIVMSTFLICFLPYHVQRTVHLHYLKNRGESCSDIDMQKSVVITLCLASVNTCIDPLLYFFSGEHFRRRLSTLRQTSVTNQQSQKRTQSIVPTERTIADDSFS
ncbi:cysteinyl leukotriene receptor 1 [Protopterus annectens]|uniref:cysteinyl leukotriene receptor 1 n=1 Tax=Protopterus annectens TaxID=7888 RepID=UPI001CFAFEE1|nr:cysteinyl leukotriene receptor 1 [Protopterus annectens]XP_043913384.1 cysteinyl leukotriene receptor 1 [Protopterus annectens]XP_043913385.1 cysteinyl leukotriene receptor 1 [Protopterus annectens]XP_043913386.1 cysteinyl leukotriene receptor 1 [Protopterus annectens]